MKKTLWNEGWEYWETENEGIPARVPVDTIKLSLPHDAMLSKAAQEKSRNGLNTGYRDGAVSHYRKLFFVEEDKKERTLTLRFDGIYMNSFVYVNGQLAARCPYGYTTFYVPLEDDLKYGQENEIHVIVKNSGAANSRWYSGGGIYRDVYLLEGGRASLLPDRFEITTEDLDGDYAAIRICFTARNRNGYKEDFTALIRVCDENGQTAAEHRIPFRMRAGREFTTGVSLLINNPAVWSADTPSLYTCEVRLMCDGEQADTASDTFGIRTLKLDAKRGLRVNGKPVKLKGTCLHHDSGLLGAATYEEAHVRQLTILKKAGFNAVRMSHHPMAPAMLRACDKVGMYVMDESFDMWTEGKTDFDYSQFFNDWWRRDVEAMVRKDYNHPSVLMYSIGNEIPECGTDRGIELGREMAEFIRSMDPHRYILESVNGVLSVSSAEIDQIVLDIAAGIGEQNASGDINVFMAVMNEHMAEIVNHPLITDRLERITAGMDIAGYNYMSSRYKNDRQAYPNRVIVGSETYPPAIAADWDTVMECPNVIGEFTWTGWDYIGETGIGIVTYDPNVFRGGSLFPNQLSYVGDIDITGVRKPMSYLREVVFDHKKGPYIAVRNPEHYGKQEYRTPWSLGDFSLCWNWDGYEGKPVSVEVFSAAPEVELFLNGYSVGRRPAGRDHGYRAVFDIVYEAGELRAAALDGEEVIGSCILASASAERRISAEPEQTWGDQLIFLPIRVIDEKGILAADAKGKITVDVEGAAVLAGLGSGDYAPVYNYTERKTELFEGQALAILKRQGNGPVTITVESSNYGTCTVRTVVE